MVSGPILVLLSIGRLQPLVSVAIHGPSQRQYLRLSFDGGSRGVNELGSGGAVLHFCYDEHIDTVIQLLHGNKTAIELFEFPDAAAATAPSTVCNRDNSDTINVPDESDTSWNEIELYRGSYFFGDSVTSHLAEYLALIDGLYALKCIINSSDKRLLMTSNRGNQKVTGDVELQLGSPKLETKMRNVDENNRRYFNESNGAQVDCLQNNDEIQASNCIDQSQDIIFPSILNRLKFNGNGEDYDRNNLPNNFFRIQGDSEIVINNLLKRFPPRNKILRSAHITAAALLDSINEYSLYHIYRDKNNIADELSTIGALNRKTVSFVDIPMIPTGSSSSQRYKLGCDILDKFLDNFTSLRTSTVISTGDLTTSCNSSSTININSVADYSNCTPTIISSDSVLSCLISSEVEQRKYDEIQNQLEVLLEDNFGSSSPVVNVNREDTKSKVVKAFINSQENIDDVSNHRQSLGGVLFFKVCMDEIPQYLRSTYEQFSVDLIFNDVSVSVPINFEYDKKEQKSHVFEKKYLKSVQTSKISKNRKKNSIHSRNNFVDQLEYESRALDSIGSLDDYRHVLESESMTSLNLKVIKRMKKNENSVYISPPLIITCIHDDDVCKETSTKTMNDDDIHGVPLNLMLGSKGIESQERDMISLEHNSLWHSSYSLSLPLSMSYSLNPEKRVTNARNPEKQVFNEKKNSFEDILCLKIDEKEIDELKITVKISYFPFIQHASIDDEIPQGVPFQTDDKIPQGVPFQTDDTIPQGVSFQTDDKIPQGVPFQTENKIPQGVPFQTDDKIPQGGAFVKTSSRTPSFSPSGSLQRFLTGNHGDLGLIGDHDYMASLTLFFIFYILNYYHFYYINPYIFKSF